MENFSMEIEALYIEVCSLAEEQGATAEAAAAASTEAAAAAAETVSGYTFDYEKVLAANTPYTKLGAEAPVLAPTALTVSAFEARLNKPLKDAFVIIPAGREDLYDTIVKAAKADGGLALDRTSSNKVQVIKLRCRSGGKPWYLAVFYLKDASVVEGLRTARSENWKKTCSGKVYASAADECVMKNGFIAATNDDDTLEDLTERKDTARAGFTSLTLVLP
jgi:hypothetical protein